MMAISPLFNRLPLCGNRSWWLLFLSCLIFLPGYMIYEFNNYHFCFYVWDWLLITTILTVMVGLVSYRGIPGDFAQTLDRLHTRNIAHVDEDSFNKLSEYINDKCQFWQRVIAITCALVIVIMFVVMFILSEKFRLEQLFLALGQTIGAYIAGNYIGKMICFGRLGHYFEQKSIKLSVDPLHVDGVGGLKPLGDYYYKQASIVALPAIFLCLWVIIFQLFPNIFARYDNWQIPYLGALIIAIIFEILAFIIPLWSFHKLMMAEKTLWIKAADEISLRIHKLHENKEAKVANKDNTDIDELIKHLEKKFWAIEKLPTWPISVSIRRRFGIKNVVLIIPVIFNIVNQFNEIIAFLEKIGKIL